MGHHGQDRVSVQFAPRTNHRGKVVLVMLPSFTSRVLLLAVSGVALGVVSSSSAAQSSGIRLSWPVTSKVVPADSQLRVRISQSSRRQRSVSVTLLRKSGDNGYVVVSAAKRRSGTITVPSLVADSQYRLVARVSNHVLKSSRFRTTSATAEAPASPPKVSRGDIACTSDALAGTVTPTPATVAPEAAVTAIWRNTGSCTFVVTSRSWIASDGTSTATTSTAPEPLSVDLYGPGTVGQVSLVAPAVPGLYTLRLTVANAYIAAPTRSLDSTVTVTAN